MLLSLRVVKDSVAQCGASLLNVKRAFALPVKRVPIGLRTAPILRLQAWQGTANRAASPAATAFVTIAASASERA
jgi:hypothetical protein